MYIWEGIDRSHTCKQFRRVAMPVTNDIKIDHYSASERRFNDISLPKKELFVGMYVRIKRISVPPRRMRQKLLVPEQVKSLPNSPFHS